MDDPVTPWYLIKKEEATKKMLRSRAIFFSVCVLYLLPIGFYVLPYLLSPHHFAQRRLPSAGYTGTDRGGFVDVTFENGIFTTIDWRYDSIIAYVGLGFLAAALYLIWANHSEVRRLERLAAPGHTLEAYEPKVKTLAWIVWIDVLHADARTNQLRQFSYAILAAGLIMAFAGLSIFYITIPSSISLVSNGRASEFSRWMLVGRAGALLLFIETIALFLLKQHRAVTEDFKEFYRLYLRRANYLLGAALAAESSNAEAHRTTVLTALLQEDLSGRLKQGETTEEIEIVRELQKEKGAISEALGKLVELAKAVQPGGK